MDDSSHDPSSAVGADSCRSGDPYEFSDDGVHASRGSLIEPDLFSPGTSRVGDLMLKCCYLHVNMKILLPGCSHTACSSHNP